MQLDEWGKVAFMEAPLPDDDSELAAEFARLASAPFVERTVTLADAHAVETSRGPRYTSQSSARTVGCARRRPRMRRQGSSARLRSVLAMWSPAVISHPRQLVACSAEWASDGRGAPSVGLTCRAAGSQGNPPTRAKHSFITRIGSCVPL